MSMVINTNLASINAQRHISTAVRDQSEAMERLSSGQRINSARDDAAGLGISNRMTSQIRGLDQAVRNANDGISMIQTAEGALDQTTNVLQRMRELSIQSANGTYNDGENRASLDAEFKQLLEEIDRIAESTKFNGNTILDGNMQKTSLQVGADAYQTVDFSIGDMSTKALGMGSTDSDMAGAAMTLTAASDFSLGYNDVLINGQSIIKSGENAFTAGSSADILVNAINNNVNGVSASLATTAELRITGEGVLSGTNEFKATLTMTDGSTKEIEVRDTTSIDNLVEKLNDISAGALQATVDGENLVITGGPDVYQIDIADSTSAVGATSKTVYAALALTADNGDPITVERGTTGTFADLHTLGFRENTDPGVIEGYAIPSAGTVWNPGDISINGVSVYENTTSSSLLSKVEAINDVSNQTGVKAETFVSAEIDLNGVTFTAGAGLTINGTTIGAATSASDLVAEINSSSSTTGITAKLSGTDIQLEGNAASLTLSTSAGSSLTAASIDYGTSNSAASTTLNSADSTVNGGFKLTSESGSPISIDFGTAASADTHGLMEQNNVGGNASGTSISSLSIDTAANSQKAVGSIDKAINTVNLQRGELGAINNRLEFTIDSMQNVSQQTSAARSRIVDADFAKESAALSKSQVLQQAASAMLAQANSAPQQVLSLLRG